MSRWRDARRSKNQFKPSSNAEREFARALKAVARNAGHIVEAHTEGANLRAAEKMMESLERYSQLIGPWAEKQSAKLLEQVNKSNMRAYNNKSKVMGKAIKLGLGNTEVGKVGRNLLHEQVNLIKSLPLEAGLRAQNIAAKNILNGTRANPDPQVVAQLKEEMGMSTEVAVRRAQLIARTETARSNEAFTQARAAAVDSPGYIWRCTMDGAERESHADMNGKFVEWSKPPRLTDGTQGHAGTFPNCRCWQDVVLPDDY